MKLATFNARVTIGCARTACVGETENGTRQGSAPSNVLHAWLGPEPSPTYDLIAVGMERLSAVRTTVLVGAHGIEIQVSIGARTRHRRKASIALSPPARRWRFMAPYFGTHKGRELICTPPCSLESDTHTSPA